MQDSGISIDSDGYGPKSQGKEAFRYRIGSLCSAFLFFCVSILSTIYSLSKSDMKQIEEIVRFLTFY